jgi:hypothetical protein
VPPVVKLAKHPKDSGDREADAGVVGEEREPGVDKAPREEVRVGTISRERLPDGGNGVSFRARVEQIQLHRRNASSGASLVALTL